MVNFIIITIAWVYYLSLVIYFGWLPINIDGLSGVLLIVGLVTLIGSVLTYVLKKGQQRKKITLFASTLSILLIGRMVYLAAMDYTNLFGKIQDVFPYF
ncbi:hypothetical protein ACFFIS_04980 [Virgibacillus soli]|uniref:Uncharacterized protein n=1 Tax=Paracerasibacillus soli TaxID=480284 RepID=A0ABU5CT64_9BACI|nr:hypothetical protein [Virgibacillus soli]MDY0409564.1 hypothetical protein [Virgibacillus soli]